MQRDRAKRVHPQDGFSATHIGIILKAAGFGTVAKARIVNGFVNETLGDAAGQLRR
jgi:hypothetical protein